MTTLALDRYGAVEAKLGPLTSGLQRAMDGGLLAAAAEADRPALAAALARAVSDGFAEASFSPILAPERRLSVSLRPRGRSGLAGMVRDITEQAAPERPPAPAFEAAPRAAGRRRGDAFAGRPRGPSWRRPWSARKPPASTPRPRPRPVPASWPI